MLVALPGCAGLNVPRPRSAGITTGITPALTCAQSAARYCMRKLAAEARRQAGSVCWLKRESCRRFEQSGDFAGQNTLHVQTKIELMDFSPL